MMRLLPMAGVWVLALHMGAQAAVTAHPKAEAEALGLAEKAIAFRSVGGPGNQTPQVAALYKQALVGGGFAPGDVTITPVGNTAYLIATWKGSDAALKPLVISGHMDVVEAKKADWTRDPFTPVVENGYLFGRGSTDMKLDGTIAIASLNALRRDGYRPRRGIVLEFSGDEETTMQTSELIAGVLKDAGLVLNIDTGSGVLDEKTGKPEYFSWSGAEKTYADFQLTVTNAGGHSSEPRPVNAIDELAAALLRIEARPFTPELSPLTKAFFLQASRYEQPAIGRAMKAFAQNPKDAQAIAVLRADFATVGEIGTTCVPTMINGGHALNALPQRATANINCRIFPGHTRASIMAVLQGMAADPGVVFADVSVGSVETEASPMDPVFVKAVQDAVWSVYPGLPVFPSMSAGASDSMWFRHAGVPSYGASGVFLKRSENFMHGLNERTPVASIAPAVDYYLSLVPALTK